MAQLGARRPRRVVLPSVKGDVADYFHLNSVGVDTDGHLLVSARNTCGGLQASPTDRQVLWRLGGKRSDFTIVPGAEFSFQHDVRRHADGTLTIFDNNAAAPDVDDALRGRSGSRSTWAR